MVSIINDRMKNWNGDVADGVRRPPISLLCADGAPCTGITLSNVNMWSQTNQAVYKCRSAFGSGLSCIQSGSPSSYPETVVSATRPPGYTTPTTMPGDLASGFPQTATIPVP